MKAYKFKKRDGEILSVRFYKSGCITIKDNNGEHEVGMWWKGECRYMGRLFGNRHDREELSQHDLGWGIAEDWVRMKKKEK